MRALLLSRRLRPAKVVQPSQSARSSQSKHRWLVSIYPDKEFYLSEYPFAIRVSHRPITAFLYRQRPRRRGTTCLVGSVSYRKDKSSFHHHRPHPLRRGRRKSGFGCILEPTPIPHCHCLEMPKRFHRPGVFHQDLPKRIQLESLLEESVEQKPNRLRILMHCLDHLVADWCLSRLSLSDSCHHRAGPVLQWI